MFHLITAAMRANLRFVMLALGVSLALGVLVLWPVYAIAPNAPVLTLGVPANSPLVGETCFATPNNGTTVYSSTTAQAVRDAVAVASATVKIAGYCPGVAFLGGTTQTLLISSNLTLAGGYTLTNWTTANPATNPTTLDAGNMGRVISSAAPSLVLRDIIVANGNITGDGGGIYAQGALSLTAVTVMSSTASGNGGGVYINNGVLGLASSVFLGNRATSNGGALYLNNVGGGSQVANTLFARNRGNGTALYVTNTLNSLHILHSTVVSPTGVGNVAVYVGGGTVYLTNTLITSHTTGVQGVGGVAVANRTLFFGNTYNTTGTVTNTNPATGFPSFINPAGGDFHIAGSSAARNAGIVPALSVAVDAEGDARPAQGNYDIGHDEFAALTGVGLNGPLFITVSTPSVFTALLTPTTAGRSFTYTWQAVGQVPIVHANVFTIADSATFTWGGAISPVITLTVSGAGGVVSATRTATQVLPVPRIGGRVFVDDDGDGEPGLPNVLLTLSSTVGTPVWLTTTTDPLGYYTFAGIPAGSYLITETVPTGYGAGSDNPKSTSVAANGVAIVNFSNVPNAVVRGIIFKDANGDGVQGAAEVGLPSEALTLTNGSFTATVFSGVGGWYSLGGATPGEYTLLASTPNGHIPTLPTVRTVAVPITGSTVAHFGFIEVGLVGGVVFNDISGEGTQQADESGIGGVVLALIGIQTYTTTTDINGGYSFTNVVAGNYVVRETNPAGYVSTSPDVVAVSVSASGSAAASFGEQPASTMRGVVFNDTNGNNLKEPGEGGLSGVLVSLFATTTYTTLTDLNGVYTFTSVSAGAYDVQETDPAGYFSTSPNRVPIFVAAGGSATANFGDQLANTLSGQVFNDANADGKFASSEAPLGGRVVTLSRAGVTLGTATTGGDGRYVFVNRPAGDYTLCTTAPNGFVATLPACQNVTLTSGGSGTANFGFLAGGFVVGAAFNDLNYNWQRDALEPVFSNLGVQLRNESGTVVFSTTTTGAGAFALPFATPGVYSVCATPPVGYISLFWGDCYWVYAPAGSSTPVNLNFMEAWAIQGAVFNDFDGNNWQATGEEGLGGALVVLSSTTGLITQTTSNAGLYRFGALAPGWYQVKVITLPNYLNTNPWGQNGWSDPILLTTTYAQLFQVLNFGQQRVGAVGGQVYDDLNYNWWRDPTELGVSGVVMTLTRTTAPTATFTLTTTASGHYLFENLANGNYQLSHSLPQGYTSYDANPYSFTYNSATVSRIPSFRYFHYAGNAIKGMVYHDFNGNGHMDVGEDGLAGVQVVLWQLNTPWLTTTTTTNGAYQFLDLPLNYSYVIRETTPPGYVSVTSNAKIVRLDWNTTSAIVNFGDRAVGWITGNVFNDLNGNQQPDLGEGMGGVTVTLVYGGSTLTTTRTSSDGNYAFQVAAGNYQVVATDLPGYVSVTPNQQSVVVAPQGSASANFGDLALGWVVGEVFNDENANGLRDPWEMGLGGAGLELNGSTLLTTTSVGNGVYRFQQVAPGPYFVLETDPPGYASTTPNYSAIAVPALGNATASFGDWPVGGMRGFAFEDRNGNGLQEMGEVGLFGITITLRGGNNLLLTTTTDASGRYQFTGIISGTYTVSEVDPTGYASTTPNTLPVAIAAGGNATANFGDVPGNTLNGALWNDLDGNGVRNLGEMGIGGIMITATHRTNNTTFTTTTQGDGSYQFLAMADGPYWVTAASVPGYINVTANAQTPFLPLAGSASANFGVKEMGTVSGVVWNDVDGHGQHDPNEHGFGGVLVVLSRGAVVVTQTTSGDGYYAFRGVAAGTYTLAVTSVISMVSTTPMTQTVIFSDNSSDTANFGFQRRGVITGRVFVDRNGNGLQDGAELGQGDVTVTLLNSAGVVTATTQTAGNGTFEFSGLVADRYVVRETDPFTWTSTTPNTVVVGIADGGNFSVNFGDALPGAIAGAIFNDTDGNGVRGPSEIGISGITLRLYQDGFLRDQTVSLGDGGFTFLGLTPGTYTVVKTNPVSYTSSSRDQVQVVLVGEPNVGFLATSHAGANANVNFGIMATGVFQGVVFNDSNGSEFRDASEAGIPSVEVKLSQAGVPIATMPTEGDGSYIFTIESGTYLLVETDLENWVSSTPNEWNLELSDGSTIITNFGDRFAAIAGNVVGLINPWASSTLPTWAQGNTDWADVPLRDVTIELRDENNALVDTTETDNDGNYQFLSLETGVYTVWMLRPDYGISNYWHKIEWWNWEDPFETVDYQAGAAETVNFRVQYDPCVLGRVYSDLNLDGQYNTGEPVFGGIQVNLKDPVGTVVSTTQTQADGSYLLLDVPLGSYQAEVVPPPGWAVATENPVAVALTHPEQGANISFGLAPTAGAGGALLGRSASSVGVVQGQVLDASGRGLAGVTLTLQDQAGNLLGQATTIVNGDYVIDNIPVGLVTVVASDLPNYLSITPNRRAVVVQAGQTAVASFVDVHQKQSIWGTVFDDKNGNGLYDPGEYGLGGLPMQLVQGGVVRQVVTTTANGWYAFNLVTGPYRVIAAARPNYAATTPNSVEGWGPALLNFGYRYQTGQATIFGRVYNDANGNGVQDMVERGFSGANMRLYTLAGAFVMTATTTGDGQYQFANLAPAAYQVVVTDDIGFLATTPATVTTWAANNTVAATNFGRRYVGLVPGRGKLAGLVFQDLNGDQHLTPGEPPLVGAQIRVWSGATLIAETLSLGDGNYLIDLAAGQYTVELVAPTGFTATTRARWPIALEATQITALPLGVRPLGTLSGVAFFDHNGDGALSRIDRGAGGFTVTLRGAGGAILATTNTSVDGFYAFGQVADGMYTVTLELPAGLAATTPVARAVAFNATTTPSANFGVQVAGALGGFVYRDLNGNGRFDAGETGLSGVQISVVGLTLTQNLTTASDGRYQLLGLPAGVYTVTETDPAGFSSTGNTQVVTLSGAAFANFGDHPVTTVSGNLFYDADMDGQQAMAEPGLGGAVVQLKNASGQVVATTIAHSTGAYVFRAVPAGNYTVIVIEPTGFFATTLRQVAVTLASNGSVAVNFGLWNTIPNTSVVKLYLPFIRR